MLNRQFYQLLFLSMIVGAIAGLLMALFEFCFQHSQDFILQTIPKLIEPKYPFITPYWALIVAPLGGLLVGISVHLWGDIPIGFESSLSQIAQRGRVEYQGMLAIFFQGLIALSFGGAVGPEGPFSYLTSGIGSWFSDRIKANPEKTATLTIAGLSGMLGPYFKSPFGSTLIMLEQPHKQEHQTYIMLLIPSVLAAISALCVFRLLVGLLYANDYRFPSYEGAVLLQVPNGLLVGITIGLWLKYVKGTLTHRVEYLFTPLKNRKILRGFLGGLGLGILAMITPYALGSGEGDTANLVRSATQLGAPMVFVIAFIKLLANVICMACGYKGGNFFPILFSCVSLAMAMSLILPFLPASIAASSAMVAGLTVITKTPIAVVILLSGVIPANLTPIVAIAAIASYITISTNINESA
ncbi:probable chloride channel [Chroococcus sp. FPU101]|nr:probable chloride channel [Chroococcus sp. FPU101]